MEKEIEAFAWVLRKTSSLGVDVCVYCTDEGDFLHIHPDEESARKALPPSSPKNWYLVPIKITYQTPHHNQGKAVLNHAKKK